MDLLNEASERDAGRDTERLQRVDGAYFHGFCDKGDDLVYTSGPIKHVVEEGIHDVTVYGMKAKFYYWVAIAPYWPGGKRPRGLVVLEGTDSEIDAKAKFNRKQDGL
ncbi:hypothetical protein pEaSNUABM37_00257 [Erwinia phage pEa_SNUABM_37]|nr:hypothetical protein pEaSNUABM37_00257 [Erwinia phage pEa_SNUABM_37]QXO10725.1 hypothetical protein pEaSNUABM48_00257 [Erwinia phage pEa_SNUABM_48]